MASATDIRAVETVVAEYGVALNGGDAARLRETLDRDAVCLLPNEKPLEGADAIALWFTDGVFRASPLNISHHIAELEVAGEWAFARGAYRTAAGGAQSDVYPAAGHFLHICRRQADGSWRLARLMVSGAEQVRADSGVFRSPAHTLRTPAGGSMMTARTAGDVTVVEVRGRMVFQEGDDDFQKFVQALIGRGCVKIVLDLGAVPYVDSTALGQIVTSHTSLARRGGALKLLHVAPRVQELLTITKLMPVFAQFDRESDAVASFRDVGA